MSRPREINFEDLVQRAEPDVPWAKHFKKFPTLSNFESLIGIKSLYLKPMFGGLALYLGDYLSLILMESPYDYRYKNKVSDFPIWDGVLIATDHPHHAKLKKVISSLINHPVLPKWLYLQKSVRSFEKDCLKLCELVKKKSPLIGVKKKKKKKKNSAI